ncbi:MAG: hypothetical protein ACKVS7_16375 [Gemmatimonadaceae bacterium]
MLLLSGCAAEPELAPPTTSTLERLPRPVTCGPGEVARFGTIAYTSLDDALAAMARVRAQSSHAACGVARNSAVADPTPVRG